MAKFIVNVYNESDKGIVGAEVYITDENGRVQSVEIVDAEELKELQAKLDAIGEEYVTWDGYWRYLENNTTSHVIDAQTLDGFTAKELLGQVNIPEGHSVIDNLNSDSRTDGLSARLGKELNNRVSALEAGGSSSGGSGWVSEAKFNTLMDRVKTLEERNSQLANQMDIVGKMATKFDIIRDKGTDGGFDGYGYASLDLQTGQTKRLRMTYPYFQTAPSTLGSNISMIGKSVEWMIGDKFYKDTFNDPWTSEGINVTNDRGKYMALAVVKGADKKDVGNDIPYGFAVKMIEVH